VYFNRTRSPIFIWVYFPNFPARYRLSVWARNTGRTASPQTFSVDLDSTAFITATAADGTNYQEYTTNVNIPQGGTATVIVRPLAAEVDLLVDDLCLRILEVIGDERLRDRVSRVLRNSELG
jgi:hypothetical protein